MKVAIVGAGPAGSHLAYQLAVDGFDALLFDARDAWEKPCGGGVTSKALREFDFLRDGPAQKQMISSLRLISARDRVLTVTPRDDFAIYSRRELSAMMRQRAVDAGAQLHCSRVERTEFGNGKWRIETSDGNFTADFLVGADGASSVIRRRVGVKFEPKDFAYALGWHVRDSQPPSRVDVKYLDEFSGYLWLFPRTDHISYGIASGYRETTPARLKALLIEFIEAQDSGLAHELKMASGNSSLRASFYAAMIPALDVSTWDRLKVCDAKHGWALIGDAAGFVDPITEEGIYYAIKSADLLSKALLSNINLYEDMWRSNFGLELRHAALIRKHFYSGRFARGAVTDRMIQIAQHHRGIRNILCDLISGDQGYVNLKNQLLKKLLSPV
jgi:geranylgeranyl reductase family protein